MKDLSISLCELIPHHVINSMVSDAVRQMVGRCRSMRVAIIQRLFQAPHKNNGGRFKERLYIAHNGPLGGVLAILQKGYSTVLLGYRTRNI